VSSNTDFSTLPLLLFELYLLINFELLRCIHSFTKPSDFRKLLGTQQTIVRK